ncbi:MAG: hypothetical protein ACJAWV_002752 [Flammeovirgaceae bacterium]|jgi:acyl-coenzyme A thioesterase 13
MSNPIVEALKAQIGKSMKGVSPVGQWLNGTLLAIEEGELTVSIKVRKEMTNPMGILHGGMSALIMDEVIGGGVYTLNRDTFFTSVNLSVDFLSSIPMGENVIAKCQIVRAGKTIVNAECQLFTEDDKLIAKGMSNLIRTFKPIK